MSVAGDRNEETSLKQHFDKLQASSRFQINYPKSMEEIGSKSNAAFAQNKMEFLRSKFRNEINKVANGLAREMENIGQDQGKLIRGATEQIEANLDELAGIRELKRIDKAMQNQEHYNIDIRNDFTAQLEKLGLGLNPAPGMTTSATVRLDKQPSRPKEVLTHAATVKTKRPMVEKGFIMNLYQQEFHKRSAHKGYLQRKFREMQTHSGETFEC
mmetsp:Transcript_16745/g.25805  ORF Transcript_16745/g.25805 Transcript_16745/m.25805 type:complete len:214 (+) Transcript_16745:333-974(+)